MVLTSSSRGPGNGRGSASIPRRRGEESHSHGSHFSQACINQRQADGADDVAPEKIGRPSVCEDEGNKSERESVLDSNLGFKGDLIERE